MTRSKSLEQKQIQVLALKIHMPIVLDKRKDEFLLRIKRIILHFAI